MRSPPRSRAYGVIVALIMIGATAGIGVFFWRVAGPEVQRYDEEVRLAQQAQVQAAQPAPPPAPTPAPARPAAELAAADTTPVVEWTRSPAQALADTLYLLRQAGRLPEALGALEGWLAQRPDDRARRLAAGQLAFEIGQPQRAVGHYHTYLKDEADAELRDSLVRRVVRELPPNDAETALTTLLDVDGPRYPVRIALARLSADQGDVREADQLLTPVPPRSDPAVDSLRRRVRAAYDPDVATAAQAVAEYPEEPQYQLAYARALRRAGRTAESLSHYRAALGPTSSVALLEEVADGAIVSDSFPLASTLLASVLQQQPARMGTRLTYARVLVRAGDTAGAVAAFTALLAERPSDALLDEARGTLAGVEQVALTIPLRQRLLRWRPDDASTRFRLALDLESTREFAAAEAHVDTLLATAPVEVPMYLMRARLRAARSNLTGAIADLRSAEAMDPTVDVALLEGDIRRWTGLASERSAAQEAYDRAARRAPAGDARIADRAALMAEQRRQLLRWEPDYGTTVLSQGLGDTQGFSSYLLRYQSGMAPFSDLTVLTVGAELRRVTGDVTPATRGFAGDVGLSRRFAGLGWRLRAGGVAFENAPTTFTGLVEATHWGKVHTLRGTVSRQPAYQLLRSGETVTADEVLRGTTVGLTANGSVRDSALEYYVQAEQMATGDGNRIGVGAVFLRVPLSAHFGVLLSTSGMTFRDTTSRYWSPEWFLMHGAGLEYRKAVPRGLSVLARLQPTYASVLEPEFGFPLRVKRSWQANGTLDLGWRREDWEVAAFGGYGQDRGGAYSAGFGGLRARILW
jgi:thioredoxin-like negative regulator of GroEL